MEAKVVRAKQAKVKSSGKDSPYEAASFAMVRAPLLPIESCSNLTQDRILELLSDARVRCAVTVGSPSLMNAFDRFQKNGLLGRDAGRMWSKLRRYLIRLATRPTPYGLFAGVGLSAWGQHTDFEIVASNARTRTRPDMGWLMELVFEAESNPAIRCHMKMVANPLVAIHGGRLFLADRAPGKKPQPVGPVSLRATGVVKRVLALSQRPVAYEDLVSAILAEARNATKDKANKLLSELWEQTVLLTDLRPPLTVEDPSAYVAAKLRAVPEAHELLAKLNGLLKAAEEWEALDNGAQASRFANLLSAAGVPADGSEAVPLQTDMAMSLRGGINREVAREAERAACLLLRLSPAPRGSGRLAAYRQAFVNRYGRDREVDLLEMLDSHRGLGPHTNYGFGHTGPSASKSSERARVLTDLACRALRSRELAINLDDKLIEQLATNALENVPLSLDLNLLVAARSAAAIDRGEFEIVVGPNLGAQAACRNLGRFTTLLGNEGLSAVQEVTQAEEERTPGEVWAEIVYLPKNMRMANVVIRPVFREFQAVFGTVAEDGVKVVPLDELVVGVAGERMYVRWPKAGKRVRFSAGHMLNHHGATPVVRFLSDMANEGCAVFSSFDWGPVDRFPFLPRVQAGRVVLQPAQWRIHKQTMAGLGLGEWREEWNVPQMVHLSVGDNRLMLNLNEEEDASELLSEIRKLDAEQSVILQEVIPALDKVWPGGKDGHYYSEFVVSLVRRKNVSSTAEDHEEAVAQAIATPRYRPPGTEWLFVKLYCPAHLEDELITGPLLKFAEMASNAKLTDGWFFIRYSDPHRHLRLRFRGSPSRLAGHLLPHVCDWANRLVEEGLLERFVFDSYERELERYGGESGLAVAEDIFAVDSLYSARILGLLRGAAWAAEQETNIFALTVNDFLEGLGVSQVERAKWLDKQVDWRAADVGTEYRKRKDELRGAVGDPGGFLNQLHGGAGLLELFAERRTALTTSAAALAKLAVEGELMKPLDDILDSLVHLHLNRLAGGERVSEQRIKSLLMRALDSLKHAPVVRR